MMTELVVVPNCSEEENVQRCISSGFTPCCAELVSFSAIRVSDAHTATTKGGMTMVLDSQPKVGGVVQKILSSEWNWLQHWDWQTDQLKWRTWSYLQQNYQIHKTVQLQQRCNGRRQLKLEVSNCMWKDKTLLDQENWDARLPCKWNFSSCVLGKQYWKYEFSH